MLFCYALVSLVHSLVCLLFCVCGAPCQSVALPSPSSPFSAPISVQTYSKPLKASLTLRDALPKPLLGAQVDEKGQPLPRSASEMGDEGEDGEDGEEYVFVDEDGNIVDEDGEPVQGEDEDGEG